MQITMMTYGKIYVKENVQLKKHLTKVGMHITYMKAQKISANIVE